MLAILRQLRRQRLGIERLPAAGAFAFASLSNIDAALRAKTRSTATPQRLHWHFLAPTTLHRGGQGHLRKDQLNESPF